MKLRPGDLVLVAWLDIVTEAHGEIREADVMRFESVARFIKWKQTKHGKVLVTTDCMERNGDPYGYTAYPKGCVLKLKRIKGVT